MSNEKKEQIGTANKIPLFSLPRYFAFLSFLSFSVCVCVSHFNSGNIAILHRENMGMQNGGRLPVDADFRISRSGSLFRRHVRPIHEGSSLVRYTLRLIRIDVCTNGAQRDFTKYNITDANLCVEINLSVVLLEAKFSESSSAHFHRISSVSLMTRFRNQL